MRSLGFAAGATLGIVSIATFAETVNAARENAGMSYRELSAQMADAGCNLSLATVHSLLSGRLRRPPRAEVVRTLAAVLDLDAAALIELLYECDHTTE